MTRRAVEAAGVAVLLMALGFLVPFLSFPDRPRTLTGLLVSVVGLGLAFYLGAAGYQNGGILVALVGVALANVLTLAAWAGVVLTATVWFGPHEEQASTQAKSN